MLGIALDERLDEGSLPNARRTDDGNDCWRRFGGEAVDKGDMEALLFDLESSSETEFNRCKIDKIHRGSAPLASVVCQGWRRRTLWDFCLRRSARDQWRGMFDSDLPYASS